MKDESNDQEFVEWYNTYSDAIFRHCYFRLKGDRETAKEFVQETFIRTWKYRKTHEIHNIRAFLYRVATNLIINESRRAKRPTVSLDYLRDELKKIIPVEIVEEPQGDFLQEVKKLAHKEGALLIFDEIVTGFRFALGGAQEYFGVVPDLACFGKSMANGMPISVVVGKAKYMKHMEDIFFSFTFGGECLSLAASLATIEEIEKKHVIKHLWRIGRMLKEGTHELLEKYGLHDFIELKGSPPWHIVAIRPAAGFSDLEIKSFIQQEMLQRGVLWTGSHNMSFSHGEKEVRIVLNAYDKTFRALQDALRLRTLRASLRGKPIQGNYNVRAI